MCITGKMTIFDPTVSNFVIFFSKPIPLFHLLISDKLWDDMFLYLAAKAYHIIKRDKKVTNYNFNLCAHSP